MIRVTKSGYPLPHETISKYWFPREPIKLAQISWDQMHLDEIFRRAQKIMFTLKAIEEVFKIKPLVLKVLNENLLLFVRKF